MHLFTGPAHYKKTGILQRVWLLKTDSVSKSLLFKDMHMSV